MPFRVFSPPSNKNLSSQAKDVNEIKRIGVQLLIVRLLGSTLRQIVREIVLRSGDLPKSNLNSTLVLNSFDLLLNLQEQVEIGGLASSAVQPVPVPPNVHPLRDPFDEVFRVGGQNDFVESSVALSSKNLGVIIDRFTSVLLTESSNGD